MAKYCGPGGKKRGSKKGVPKKKSGAMKKGWRKC